MFSADEDNTVKYKQVKTTETHSDIYFTLHRIWRENGPGSSEVGRRDVFWKHCGFLYLSVPGDTVTSDSVTGPRRSTAEMRVIETNYTNK